MAKPELVYPDGRPIDFDALRREEAEAEMAGVRQAWSGHPSVGLTPERAASLLLQAEEGDATAYLELAEDMEEKDLHYLAVLGTRKRQVSQLDITVDAASDDPNDIENADMAREVLARDDIEAVLFDILDAVGKGYSSTEIVWDMSERQWWPEKLIWRDPRWFGFDRVNRRTLMLRVNGGVSAGAAAADPNAALNFGLQPLSPYKYITHIHKAKSGLPIRGGLARAAVWAYMFRNYALKDWVAFCEVYGQPLRLGKYTPGATADEKRTLLRAVSNIGTDAAAIIPRTMDLELMSDQARRDGGDLYQNLEEYLERQISKAVLGQTTTTDAISGGHAVSQEHNEVRGDIERADAKQLAASISCFLIRPLIDLNKGPQKAYPRVKIGRSESIDIPVMAEALAKLVPMGLRVQASEVRDRIGFSDPPADAEVLMPPAQPTFGFPGAPAQPGDLSLNAAGAGTPPATVDRIVNNLAERAGPVTDAMVAQVRALVESANSLEDVADGLAELFPAIDAGQLAALMRRAMAVANLAGRSDIVDRA